MTQPNSIRSPQYRRMINQTILWVNGISRHNKVDNQCTPDNSCCHKAEKTTLQYRMNVLGKVIKRQRDEDVYQVLLAISRAV